MWNDIESDIDFLHFGPVANSVLDCISASGSSPICIGVSGEWGTGKTTLLRLVESKLKKKASQCLYVRFNAWMYQGFDDARAALMESIASAIEADAKENPDLLAKAKKLLKRINWFRVAGTAATTVATTALGIPPIGLMGGLWSAIKGTADGKLDEGSIEVAIKSAKELGESMVNEVESPPKQLSDIRNGFEEALSTSKKCLVVFIDDLDRCLPKTAIETLEAIRLFLFIKNTAFIVAADTTMIRDSVRKHFSGLSESYVTSYFDKLIQVPIPVPAIGAAESTAYMFNLHIENSSLDAEQKEKARTYIEKKVEDSWKGDPLKADRLLEHISTTDAILTDRLRVAQSLAPMMCSPQIVSGNPRLIKRFLNTISIRTKAASSLGHNLSETIFIKLHLIERFSPQLYEVMVREIAEDRNGKSRSIAAIEEGKEIDGATNDLFHDWRRLPSTLTDIDLRPYIQVARSRAAIDVGARPMSTRASDLLAATISQPKESSLLLRDEKFTDEDAVQFTEAYLSHCSSIHEWGSNAETLVLIAMAEKTKAAQEMVVGFLSTRSAHSLHPGLVPKIRTLDWSRRVFAAWKTRGGLSSTVAAAIANIEKKG